MKQGHLLVIFLLIYGSCFLALHFEQKSYDRVLDEKQQTEQALLEAIEYTAFRYKAVLNDSEEKRKQVISASFSEAIYISMGLLGTAEQKEFWRLYVPMIVLVEEDGAYFYYVNEKSEQRIFHEWSEKVSFDIPEESSEAKRISIMADTLEEKASQIISNHNLIAAQYGITYSYSLPVFFQDTSQTPEFPMLLVVFQGWPLNTAGTVFYENCLDAGVFLRQKLE